jgi:putative addiction module component (TIGR02574 family)
MDVFCKFGFMDPLQQILKLSTAERLLLIEKIWDTITPDSLPISESHKKETSRRMDLVKKGKMKFYSWDEVKKKARAKK